MVCESVENEFMSYRRGCTDQVLESTQECGDRRITQSLDELFLNFLAHIATQKFLFGIVELRKVQISAISRYVGLILCQVTG